MDSGRGQIPTESRRPADRPAGPGPATPPGPAPAAPAAYPAPSAPTTLPAAAPPAGWSPPAPGGPASRGTGTDQGWASRFFGVIARSRTWLNAVYLFLAFPLGLVYFLVLVVGTALGVGLVILWVGIPILLVVMAAWWAFAAFERRLADALLGTSCGPSPRPWEAAENPLGRMKAALSHTSTWKGLAFTLIKFPFGVISFAILVSLVAFVDYMIFAPVWAAVSVGPSGPSFFGWHPGSWYAALALVPVGLIALFVGLHLINAVAAGWRLLVEGLLVEEPPVQTPPAGPSVSTWAAAPQAQWTQQGWSAQQPWQAQQTQQPQWQTQQTQWQAQADWPAPGQPAQPTQPAQPAQAQPTQLAQPTDPARPQPPVQPSHQPLPGAAGPQPVAEPVQQLDTNAISPGDDRPDPAQSPDTPKEDAP